MYRVIDSMKDFRTFLKENLVDHDCYIDYSSERKKLISAVCNKTNMIRETVRVPNKIVTEYFSNYGYYDDFLPERNWKITDDGVSVDFA